MRRVAIVVAAGVLALGARAGAGATLTDAERARAEKEVRATVQAFVAAINAADADRALAYFSSAPDFREADATGAFATRAEFTAAYRDAYAKLQSQDRRLADERLDVLGPDLVLYTAGGTFSLTFKTGKVTPPTPIAWTLLWRREAGQWKVAVAHQSFVPSAAP